MDNLTDARNSLTAEISRLATEQRRLEKVLEALNSGPGATRTSGAAVATVSAAPTGKRRGRKPGSKNKPKSAPAAAGTVDIQSTIDLIKEAGKGGINVMRLNAALRKAGASKPDRETLLGSGKVKMSGRAGGTVYHYAE